MMKILVISNGHGEDLIACNIFKRASEVTTSGVSDRSNSWHRRIIYKNNMAPQIKNPIFPSGGIIRSLNDLIKDIGSGLLTHLRYQRSYIKSAKKECDACIVVGDIFGLVMSAPLTKKTFFFPTAKSHKFATHSFVETWLMKKHYSHFQETKKQQMI